NEGLLNAILTRALFILVAVIGVLRVASVKKDNNYLFLAFLLLPLVVEMIVTLKMRKGQDYKWFSPPIFLLSTVCANDWILALHQIVLILLIVGKWLLPLGGGVTKDELSQLLLTFVGTAADILEFTSETLEKNPAMVYVILAVWTWSMLQFPLHLAGHAQHSSCPMWREYVGSFVRENFFIKHSTDIWSIIETLFIQDGPFLLVRLTVIIHFRVLHQMLGFFAIKNGLVITLSLYRLAIILLDYRHPMGNNAETVDHCPLVNFLKLKIKLHSGDELCMSCF
uniref:Transmembrane protein 26a n=1 Tax=Neolamprologus brichardi TaxID=32507 RepID=A0A3Q4MRM2_NEOBR